jgi:PAS domain S-box-containing protein
MSADASPPQTKPSSNDPSVVRGLRDLAVFARTLTGRELRQRLVTHARTFFGADGAALWILEARDRIWRIAAAEGVSEEFPTVTVPAPEKVSASALLPGTLFVPDVSLHTWPAIDERRALYEREGIRAFLIMPVSVRGETVGTLACYYHTVRDPLAPAEVDAAEAFAELASVALSTDRFDQLADVARDVSGRLDLDAVVQRITDAATTLTGAQFGAFFYNVLDDKGAWYTLYTISGVPREHFERFPMPRNTAIFEPTFTGSGIVRSPNITRDPRYGKNPPYHGMPEGHLPVVSYLAVPVKSRTGEVLGGLFFGHAAEDMFGEAEENIAAALAGHAAVAIDNVRAYERIERERAALRKDERRYRSLVTATPARQAITVTNTLGQIEQDSPSWREITGQTLEEMQGSGWLQAVHPTHRERIAEEWQKALKTRHVFEAEYPLRQADGAYRWFRARAVPVFGDEDTAVEWVGNVVDIHEAHTADEVLKFLARANELFASSLDFRETLRNLAKLAVPRIADWCAVDMFDSSGEQLWNRVAVEHTDPAKVELAKALHKRYPPDPDTDTIYRVLRTGKSELIPFISDEMLVAAAKSPEHLQTLRELQIMSAMVVPLRSRGEVIGAITLIAADRRFNESDLQHAEELAYRASIAVENARLYTAAQAANRAKDEFLATLSHELRTPMTAVLGWARMLKLGLSPQEAEVAVDAIEQSAGAQAQLIEDVLDVSRIMAGKLTFSPRPTDLRTVAQAAITTVHPAAAAKGIEILTSIPPMLPPVAGDEGRLQQIIWNLLSNAIKFTTRGGSVTLRIAHEGSSVRLQVSDTGEGIEREFLPYVFEPFRQADSSTTRPHGGIGLGLAIVRSLVEMHGGRAIVASEGKGRGATFTIELPAMESAPVFVGKPAAERALLPNPTLALPSLGGLQVLVIDDQQYTRDVVAAILRKSGAVVTTADSVREGLVQFRIGEPTVVVCDIAMPEEDGYVFLREVRSRPDAARDTPILALTAFGRPEDRIRALNAGFDAYMKKPVDPAELAECIQRLATR